METMQLTEIAAALSSTVSIDAPISEISTDTRTITPGCLFIALRGERFDGHDFVAAACAQGAVAAVTEHAVAGCPCIIVPHTGRALLELAKYYRGKFSPVLVGVTGSVGKTTTKNMIALVLSAHCETLKTEGNFNNEIGLPKTLFRLNASHRAAVIEMGMSDFGEISRLTGAAQPTMAVITNIGFSHIGQLKTQEGIRKAKLEILEGMPTDGLLLVNADDALLFPLREQLQPRPVLTYGIDNPAATFRGTAVRTEETETTFTVVHADGETAVTLPCIGRHNVMNALAAFAIGRQIGMTPGEIAAALLQYQPDGMRQNFMQKGEQIVVADCYNASPDSMRASLSVLMQYPAAGRRIAVLGDMLELGAQSNVLHTLVGEMVAAAKPDALYCYGGEAKAIAEAALAGGIPTVHTTEKIALAERLKRDLLPGDVVLFKASRGMRLEDVIHALYDAESV